MTKAFRVHRGSYTYDVAHWGHIGYLAGPPGSMKSTHIKYITASALTNKPFLGYDLNLDGRLVALVDGEQPDDILTSTRMKIFELTDGQTDSLIMPSHSLSGIPDMRDRVNAMHEFLFKYYKDIGLLIIDRAGNFVTDVNHNAECTSFWTKIQRITEACKCMTLLTSHITEVKYQEPRLYGMMGSLINQTASFGFLTRRNSEYWGLLSHKTRLDSPSPPLYVTFDEEGENLLPTPYLPF